MTVQIDHSTNAITATAGSVTVNGSAPAATTLTVSNKTGVYSVVAGDNGAVIRTTSGTGAITLPSCATVGVGFNFYYTNKNGAGTTVAVNCVGSDTFSDLNATLPVPSGATIWFVVENATASGIWSIASVSATGSGASAVAIGRSSSATGTNGIAVGAQANATANTATVLGASATASATQALAVGYGVTASSSYATAIGSNSTAQSSQAVTGSGAMALGGSYASGTDSFAAAIGNNTSTYGAQGASSIAIGNLAKATGANAISLTYNGLASGTKAVALGANCVAAQVGKLAFACTFTAAQGDAQYGLMVLAATPASGSTGVLTSDLAAASTTNQLIVASGQAMTVTGMIVGKVTATAQVYSATFTAQLINNAGTVTLGAAVTLANVTDGITLTTAPTVTADNTNKGLAVTSGAKTATVIKWVCTVQSCEITY